MSRADRGIKGGRARFKDACIGVAITQTIPDPPPTEPRDGIPAGKWPGYPFNQLPPNCPVKPLGKVGNSTFYIDSIGQLICVPILRREHIPELFCIHPNYLLWAWPTENKKGKKGDLSSNESDSETKTPKIKNFEAELAKMCLLKEAGIQGQGCSVL